MLQSGSTIIAILLESSIVELLSALEGLKLLPGKAFLLSPFFWWNQIERNQFSDIVLELGIGEILPWIHISYSSIVHVVRSMVDLAVLKSIPYNLESLISQEQKNFKYRVAQAK